MSEYPGRPTTPQRPTTTRTTDPAAAPAWPVNTPRPEPTNAELGLAPATAVAPPATRRPRRGRRAGRGIGAAMLTVLTIGGIAYAVSPEHRSQDSWDATGISNVVMDLSAGDVQITQSADDKVHYSEDLVWRGGDFKTQHATNGSTLNITTAHQPIRFGFNWHDRLHYTLALPKGTSITYHQSAGDATLDGSFGTVNITTSAGDIRASSLSASSLAITTSAGDVTLNQVTAPKLTVSQSAGDSRLTFAAPPDQVDVQTSAGDVDITLPASASYTVSEHHTAGSTSITVPKDSSGQHRIGVETTAGDVKIHS